GGLLGQERDPRHSELDLVAVPQPHTAHRSPRHGQGAPLPQDPRALSAAVVEQAEPVACEVLDMGVRARDRGVDRVVAVEECNLVAAQSQGAAALDAVEPPEIDPLELELVDPATAVA